MSSKAEHFCLLSGGIKAIVHPNMKTHSISTHLYADVRMGEDLQFTKHSWSFSRKQPCSQIQYIWSKRWAVPHEQYGDILCLFCLVTIHWQVCLLQELALGWAIMRLWGVCGDVSPTVRSTWSGWALHVPVERRQLWNQEQLHLQIHCGYLWHTNSIYF